MGEAKVGGGSLNRVGSGSNMDNYAAVHNILQSERAKMRGSQGYMGQGLGIQSTQ